MKMMMGYRKWQLLLLVMALSLLVSSVGKVAGHTLRSNSEKSDMIVGIGDGGSSKAKTKITKIDANKNEI